MKIKLEIKKTLKIQPDDLEKKISNYLTNNFYRITEKGLGFVIFVDDEFSNRRRSRSDFHTRIGEGKFEFNYSSNEEMVVKLIYLTSLSYPAFIVMVFSAFGIYTNDFIMPIVISFALMISILFRIYYLKENVFAEILNSSA